MRRDAKIRVMDLSAGKSPLHVFRLALFDLMEDPDSSRAANPRNQRHFDRLGGRNRASDAFGGKIVFKALTVAQPLFQTFFAVQAA